MRMDQLEHCEVALPTPSDMHGGRIMHARRLFPAAPLPFVDLSTGINPYAYPIPILSAETWRRLPEPEAIAALEASAAKAFGVQDASMVVAAPGSAILISLVPRLLPQRSVTILGPTFGEYARSFAASEAIIQKATTFAELHNAEAIVLCNPNNPDGGRVEPARLLALVDAMPRRLCLVDEAFADLEEPPLSLAEALPRAGLVILRSFSKSYGLGGLRLGFALASPQVAEMLRAALGPWQVSGAAVQIGTRAYADENWQAETKRKLKADVGRLDRLLRTAGFEVIGGTLLFRLVRSTHAPALFTRLGEAGILTRRFAEQPQWLRFGLPAGEEEWQRLTTALG